MYSGSCGIFSFSDFATCCLCSMCLNLLFLTIFFFCPQSRSFKRPLCCLHLVSRGIRNHFVCWSMSTVFRSAGRKMDSLWSRISSTRATCAPRVERLVEWLPISLFGKTCFRIQLSIALMHESEYCWVFDLSKNVPLIFLISADVSAFKRSSGFSSAQSISWACYGSDIGVKQVG